MKNTDQELKNISNQIFRNIEKAFYDKQDRDLYAGNILKNFRDLVEVVTVKLYGSDKYSRSIFITAKDDIFSKGQYKFLRKFHKMVSWYNGHNTEVGENATRLLFAYKEYLLEIKHLLKKRYGISILTNLDKFPVNINKDLQEYYEKVSEKINCSHLESVEIGKDLFYIERIKPFFVDNKIFYEISFRIAGDYGSKFERLIAFSKIKILPNYAVKLSFKKDQIMLFGKQIDILIIYDYDISIRPCEFQNFASFFDLDIRIDRKDGEYHNLMLFLKKYHLDLLDVVLLNNAKFAEFKEEIINNGDKRVSAVKILKILDVARNIILNKKPGVNILRYLLYIFKNMTIRLQKDMNKNYKLSDLKIKFGSIQFDKTPFSFFPVNHTPKFQDLWDSLDIEDKKHDLLARFIKNNTETYGQLYTSIDSLKDFGDLKSMVDDYNKLIYESFVPAAYLIIDKNQQIYIKGYEDDAINIIEKIKSISSDGVKGYKETITAWLEEKPKDFIDDEDKRKFLLKMFENSKVGLVYGSAGTGKTKFIEYVSEYYSTRDKLLLANTNTAVYNLKKRVGKFANSTFGTVHRYANDDISTDILIIDECSTVSNSDMLKILNKIKFKFLLLVGDIYQIESIRFGNWFYIIKKLFSNIQVNLSETRRTQDKELLEFWSSVRKMKNDISTRISYNNYASSLSEYIFSKHDEDEIILCLNYDGLYGINNINKILQFNNPNQYVEWNMQRYKIGDPILFNEIQRGDFGKVLYNNLKGVIVNIEKELSDSDEDIRVIFTVDIDEVFDEYEFYDTSIEWITIDNNKTRIKFFVNTIQSQDENSNDLRDDQVPFQIAYAVSIHKAQGLEYNSVKIVITDEIDEQITHNIFYTAITRAKKNLKIYWSEETQQKILNRIKNKFNNSNKDFILLKSKYKL